MDEYRDIVTEYRKKVSDYAFKVDLNLIYNHHHQLQNDEIKILIRRINELNLTVSSSVLEKSDKLLKLIQHTWEIHNFHKFNIKDFSAQIDGLCKQLTPLLEVKNEFFGIEYYLNQLTNLDEDLKDKLTKKIQFLDKIQEVNFFLKNAKTTINSPINYSKNIFEKYVAKKKKPKKEYNQEQQKEKLWKNEFEEQEKSLLDLLENQIRYDNFIKTNEERKQFFSHQASKSPSKGKMAEAIITLLKKDVLDITQINCLITKWNETKTSLAQEEIDKLKNYLISFFDKMKNQIKDGIFFPEKYPILPLQIITESIPSAFKYLNKEYQNRYISSLKLFSIPFSINCLKFGLYSSFISIPKCGLINLILGFPRFKKDLSEMDSKSVKHCLLNFM